MPKYLEISFSEWKKITQTLHCLCVKDHGTALLQELSLINEPPTVELVNTVITNWLNEFIFPTLQARQSTQHYAGEMISIFMREYENHKLSKSLLDSLIQLNTYWKDGQVEEKAKPILTNNFHRFFYDARTGGSEHLEDMFKISKVYAEFKRNKSKKHTDITLIVADLITHFKDEKKGKLKKKYTPEKMLEMLYEIDININTHCLEYESALFSTHLPELNSDYEVFKHCVECEECPTRLQPTERAVIEAKMLQELDTETVLKTDQNLATHLNISRETLRQRFKKALTKLVQCMPWVEEVYRLGK